MIMIVQVMHLRIVALMIGVTLAQWELVHHWMFDQNINLQALTNQDVNLANANSITHGFSSVKGSTDKMYFDDIRLYPPES